MSRVIYFEIIIDDPVRAIDFYRKIFNWDITQWEGSEEYWAIKTGDKDKPGIDGGFFKRTDDFFGLGSGGYVCTIDVPYFEEYETRILENGGSKFAEKREIPGAGWHGYFKDTEGNVFGILEVTGPM